MSRLIETVACTGEVPAGRYGHTTVSGMVILWLTFCIVSKDKVVLFGGAVGSPSIPEIAQEAYLLNTRTHTWKKLVCRGSMPSPRAAHAAEVVTDLQMVVYGGTAAGMDRV